MSRHPKSLRRVRYTVRGRGPFPSDMLRYDASFPATPEDDEWIRIANEPRHRQTVELMLETFLPPSYRQDARPTHGRWRSFGWTVTEVYKTERIPWDDVPEARRPNTLY